MSRVAECVCVSLTEKVLCQLDVIYHSRSLSLRLLHKLYTSSATCQLMQHSTQPKWCVSVCLNVHLSGGLMQVQSHGANLTQ